MILTDITRVHETCLWILWHTIKSRDKILLQGMCQKDANNKQIFQMQLIQHCQR